MKDLSHLGQRHLLEELRIKGVGRWAPELKKLLLSVAIRLHEGLPPVRLVGRQPRMNTMTVQEKKEIDMWQNHINQEHLPVRRDCHDCLLGMGRDRPRRRQACPASYCLSIDIAGPFPAGIDQLAPTRCPHKEWHWRRRLRSWEEKRQQ